MKLLGWVKLLLFISAYTPLLLIFVLRYVDFPSICFWFFVSSILLINLIWIPIFKIAKGWPITEFTVEKSMNRTSDALDYIVAYIIIFLGFQFRVWQDIATIIILLIVIFFIYIHSNLIFINPILNIFGYKIHDVEVQVGGKIKTNIILITKEFKMTSGEKLFAKQMSDNIYLGVKR